MSRLPLIMNKPVQALTFREEQVLQLAGQGFTDKEIAAKLLIQLSTVRTYWERVRTKLNAVNRTHAVLLNMPHNLVDRAGEEVGEFAAKGVDDAISICDCDGIFMTWNAGVKELFGYELEEWVGKHNSLIFMPEEKDQAKQELEDADRAGVSVNDRWHLRKDGSRFWGTNIVIAFQPRNLLAAYAKIVRPKRGTLLGTG